MKRASSELPSGTVTFAALDISRTGVLGSYEIWQGICTELQELVDSVLTSFGGVKVSDRGSTVQVVYAFNKPTMALNGVVQILKESSSIADVPNALPRLRAGISSGESDIVSGSIRSNALEAAIRLKNVAHLDQILVSVSTQELARTESDESIAFRDLGNHRLHLIGRAERIFQVLSIGLLEEFPPLRSLDSAKTNIDVPRTSLTGRERELFDVSIALERERFVTITGCGGVGKSRLAREVAMRMMHDHSDGVFLIDFGSLSNPAFIAETIASELPFVQTAGVDVASRLSEQLRHRDILLVFDNCDLIRSHLGTLAEALLKVARSLRILVTSRQPLGVSLGTPYYLGSLDFEVAEGEVFSPALRLLVHWASEYVPGFELHTHQVDLGNSICELTGGVPLALQMVAAKLKVLSLEEVVAQLKVVKQQITSSDSDLQRLMDATMKWIFASLTEEEQRALARLSVFRCGWEQDAAEQVAAFERIAPLDVGRIIGLLVQKGLVSTEKRGPHVIRYSICQSLWEFCFERLRMTDEEASLRRRHAEWISDLATSSSTELAGPNQHPRLEQLDREKQNIRAAIEWCLMDAQDIESAYRIIFGVHMYWYKRGYIVEGRIWLERLLVSSGSENPEDRARALNILSIFASALGDNDGAIAYLEHALDVATKIGSQETAASVLVNLSTNHRGKKDLSKARGYLENSVQILRTLGDEYRLAMALCNLGALLSESGEYELAKDVMADALELNKRLGNRWVVVHVSFNLAELALRQSRVVQAEPLLASSISSWYEQRDFRGVAKVLKSYAIMADLIGQQDRAAVLLGASSSLNERIHQDLEDIELETHRNLVDRLSRNLGEASFFKKWAEGTSLSTDAAVTYALGQN